MPYSAAMILAKLAGRKTQTRRVMVPQPSRVKIDSRDDIYRGRKFVGTFHTTTPDSDVMTTIFAEKGPRGAVGDRHYWQEAFDFSLTNFPMIRYKADGVVEPLSLSERDAAIFAEWKKPKPGEWRGMPAMFMLPSMSRGLEEVIGVRVERVRDISEEDAIAEGVIKTDWWLGAPHRIKGTPTCWPTARDAFKSRWDYINATRDYGWSANPWVWVYKTKKVEAA